MRPLLHAAGMTAVPGEHASIAGILAGTGVPALPLAELLDTDISGTGQYWATTTINDRGRLADRTPLRVLGWVPGTAVTIALGPGAGIVVVRDGGTDAVTRQGHLRLPANIRHGCRIRAGDRLLVVAHPADGVLVVYTSATVDAMTSAYHARFAVDDVEAAG